MQYLVILEKLVIEMLVLANYSRMSSSRETF